MLEKTQVYEAMFCIAILLFVSVFIISMLTTERHVERADVWWPAGAQTAWCYWRDQSRDDLICFRGPEAIDPKVVDPWE